MPLTLEETERKILSLAAAAKTSKNNNQEMITSYKEILELFSTIQAQTKNPKVSLVKYETHFLLAKKYLLSKNPQLAFEHFTLCISAFISIPPHYIRSKDYLNLSRAYSERSLLQADKKGAIEDKIKAIENLEAFSIFCRESLKADVEIRICYAKALLAYDYFKIGNYEEARKLLSYNLQILHEIKPSDMTYSYFSALKESYAYFSLLFSLDSCFTAREGDLFHCTARLFRRNMQDQEEALQDLYLIVDGIQNEKLWDDPLTRFDKVLAVLNLIKITVKLKSFPENNILPRIFSEEFEYNEFCLLVTRTENLKKTVMNSIPTLTEIAFKTPACQQELIRMLRETQAELNELRKKVDSLGVTAITNPSAAQPNPALRLTSPALFSASTGVGASKVASAILAASHPTTKPTRKL